MHDKPMEPGWGDVADYFCDSEKKYGMANLKILAVLKPKTDKGAAAPATKTVGELMETPGIVVGKLQMGQGTS